MVIRLDRLDELYAVVVRGNGKPGLVVQMATLTEDVHALQGWKQEVSQHMQARTSERRRERWTVLTATIAAVASLVGTVLIKWMKW